MSNVQKMLYHYTTFHAFRKIMESQTLRATHCSELNDWSEVRMGVSVVLRSLQANASVIQQDTMKVLLTSLDEFKKGQKAPFVFSLSENGDVLGQWRAYSRGGGIAIGFIRDKIETHFRDVNEQRVVLDSDSTGPLVGNLSVPWRLMQCQYCTLETTIDISELVAHTDELVHIQSSKNKDAVAQVANIICGGRVRAAVEQLCCRIKHSAYQEEREWRCFFVSEDDNRLPIELDERNRRFVEIKFDPGDVIGEVVISPHGDKRQGNNLAHYFKETMCLDYRISKSLIPFRDSSRD